LQQALQAEFDVAGVICHALSLPSFVCLPMRCFWLPMLLLLLLLSTQMNTGALKEMLPSVRAN